jgi:hypothetical protein
MSQNERDQVQEMIWALRNKQSECALSERAEIEKTIQRLYKILDAG